MWWWEKDEMKMTIQFGPWWPSGLLCLCGHSSSFDGCVKSSLISQSHTFFACLKAEHFGSVGFRSEGVFFFSLLALVAPALGCLQAEEAEGIDVLTALTRLACCKQIFSLKLLSSLYLSTDLCFIRWNDGFSEVLEIKEEKARLMLAFWGPDFGKCVRAFMNLPKFFSSRYWILIYWIFWTCKCYYSVCLEF